MTNKKEKLSISNIIMLSVSLMILNEHKLIPENTNCLNCNKEIDICEYIARKNEYKNNLCFDCSKEKIKKELLTK